MCVISTIYLKSRLFPAKFVATVLGILRGKLCFPNLNQMILCVNLTKPAQAHYTTFAVVKFQ